MAQKDMTETSEENTTTEDNQESPIPIDRGWAWVVLAGASIEMMMSWGLQKASGILFVKMQERFQATSAMTSLISTIQNAMYSVGALLVMTVGMRFMSCRTSMILGSCICSLGHIITSQANSVYVALFSHGFLIGLGHSMMQPCVYITVSKYFNKRRGFANSFAVGGGSIGALVFAPLLTLLFEHYGFSGALLIIAGFYLQNCIVGALFRPLSFYTRKKTQGSNSKKQQLAQNETQNHGKETDITCSTEYQRHKRGDALLLDKPEEGNPVEILKEHQNSEQLQGLLISEKVKDVDRLKDIKNSLLVSSEMLASSFVSLDERNTTVENTRNCCSSVMKEIFSVLDLRVFRKPVFIIFLISAGPLCASNVLLPIFLPPYVKETGISLKKAAILLTTIAGLDFFIRIPIGILTDKGFFRRSSVIGFSAVLMGLLLNLLRYFRGFGALIVFSVAFGLFGGTYISFYIVILVDYLTIDRLQSCVGFSSLVHGASVAATFFLIGFIRDSTGSYIVSFHFLGCLMIFGGVLMLLLPVVHKYSRSDDT